MSGANSAAIGQLGQALGGQAKPSNPYVHTGSLEPLAMLQAYRAGQPLINPHFQRPAQFLPDALPTYTPPAPVVQAPQQLILGTGNYGRDISGGPAGGADADGGASAAAASAAAGDSVGGIGGGGGGGGGGSK